MKKLLTIVIIIAILGIIAAVGFLDITNIKK